MPNTTTDPRTLSHTVQRADANPDIHKPDDIGANNDIPDSNAHTRPDRIPGHPTTNRYTNYSGADVIRRHF